MCWVSPGQAPFWAGSLQASFCVSSKEGISVQLCPKPSLAAVTAPLLLWVTERRWSHQSSLMSPDSHRRRTVLRADLAGSNGEASEGWYENTCKPGAATQQFAEQKQSVSLEREKHVTAVAESALALQKFRLRDRVQRRNPHPLGTRSGNLLFNIFSKSTPRRLN